MWDIEYTDKVQVCRDAWGVDFFTAANMIADGDVVFYFTHEIGRDTPVVVAVEYIGIDGVVPPLEAYKEITPTPCIKKGA